MTFDQCPLCSTVPPSCFHFWKDGGDASEPLPAAVAHFEVVGAPFVRVSESDRYSCVVRCPSCGTCYRKEYDYEYLTNGNDNEITLTRLDPEAGRKAAEEVEAAVSAAHQRFRSRAAARLKALRETPEDHAMCKEVMDYLTCHGTARGFDLSAWLDDLLEVLLTLPHPQKDASGYQLRELINAIASRDADTRDRILERLATANPAQRHPRANELAADLARKKHLEALRAPSAPEAYHVAVQFFSEHGTALLHPNSRLPLDLADALLLHPHAPSGPCPGSSLAATLEGLTQQDFGFAPQVLAQLERAQTHSPEAEELARGLRVSLNRIRPHRELTPSGVMNGAWSPDGQYFVTRGDALTVFDKDGEELSSYPVETGASVAWHPEGSVIATGDSHGLVTFWAHTPGAGCTPMHRSKDRTGLTMELRWSPDGSCLLGHACFVYVVYEGQRARQLLGVYGNAGRVRWAPAGGCFATSGHAKSKPRLWLPDGTQLCALGPERAFASWLTHSTKVVTWGESTSDTTVWDREGNPVGLLGFRATHLEVSSQDRIAACVDESSLVVCEADGSGLTRTQTASAIKAIAWAGDGERLAVALDHGDVLIVDRHCVQLAVVRGNCACGSLAWSPDGAILVISLRAGKLNRLVDRDGSPLGTLPAEQRVAWSPGGERLLGWSAGRASLYGAPRL